MKQIDYQDPRPIYEQISEYYKTLILKGIMEADEQMPSVRQLAMECSTNPNTVQRAYAELERQGFIYTVKGRGNFVKGGQNLLEDRKRELAQRIVDTFREATAFGITRNELMTIVRELETQGGTGIEAAPHQGVLSVTQGESIGVARGAAGEVTND